MRAGTQLEVSFGLGPLKATVGLEITALEQNTLMEWQGEYRLEPEGANGSKLSQQGSLGFSGIWRLIQPIVGAEISKAEVKELEKLKAVIEGSGRLGA